MNSMIDVNVYNTYFDALLKGNRRTCSQTVERLIAQKVDVRDIYLNLFQKTMYKVGRLWELNRISVAVEHLATSITLNLLNLVYPLLFSEDKVDKSAVIACVTNEYHQLGSQMVTDIFELNGWNAYFLGSNTPIDDLLSFIDKQNPDIVGISIAIYFNMQNMWKMVEKVRREFPDLPVLVGGQAFRWGGLEITEEFSNITYAPTLIELEKQIQKCS